MRYLLSNHIEFYCFFPFLFLFFVFAAASSIVFDATMATHLVMSLAVSGLICDLMRKRNDYILERDALKKGM